jgi:hypothetical protein
VKYDAMRVMQCKRSGIAPEQGESCTNTGRLAQLDVYTFTG